MKNLIAAALAAMVMLPGAAQALSFATYSNVTHVRVFDNGYAMFATATRPAGTTCTNYLAFYKFNAATAEEKNMLSMLLSAKATRTGVSVWYDNSTTPDTVDAACTDVSLVHIIGMP